MDREKGYVDIYDAVSEGTKPLRELYQKIYGEIKGIPIGFTEVDKIVGALRKKDLILLAARPGMGKTTWALRVANNNAMSRSNKVLVFSLELSNAQLGKWLFTMDTGVTPEIIKKGDFSKELLERAFDHISSFRNVDMAVSEATTLDEIKKECRRFKQEKGGLDLIVIDYLQLLSMDGYRTGQGKAEVAAIVKSIKKMAEELDCAVLLLSQLSGDPDLREYDHRPRFSDLKGYCGLEQDVDVIIFLYRDDYYSSDNERNHTRVSRSAFYEVIIAKNRNGSTGVAKELCSLDPLRF